MPLDAADVDNWTATDAAEFASTLELWELHDTFRLFAKAFWDLVDPTPLVWNYHLDIICDEAQAISEEADRRRVQFDAIIAECGEDHTLRSKRIAEEIDSTPLRLVLLIPPRGSKSTLISKLFVLWRWCRRPEQFAAFSAMKDKIPEFGRSIRDTVRHPRYQHLMRTIGAGRVHGNLTTPRKDADTMSKLVLNNGGHWEGHPIGGRFTGINAETILIDDPHDVEETMGVGRSTESKDAAVAKVEGIYKSKINDRYNNKITGVCILIMQRVHMNDLAAYMIRMGARLVTIPAEYDPEVAHPRDPRTVPGEPYNPTLLPASLMALEKKNDPFGYATKFLMKPTLQEGSTIKREWFANLYNEDPHLIAKACSEIAISVDSASTTGKRSDYTSMGVWGRKGRYRILLDRKFGKWGIVALVDEFKALCKEWPEAMFKFVENKSSGIQLIEFARTAGLSGVVPVNPTVAKRDRLGYAKAALEAGDVYLPRNAPWLEEYINNMVGIDAGGAHDDDGDMTSQVMEKWSTGFAPWLTLPMRESLANIRPAAALGDHLLRWERRDQVRSRLRLDTAPTLQQTTDPTMNIFVGIVPGWAQSRAGTDAVATFVDARGVQLALIEVPSGGIDAFTESVAQEVAYWGGDKSDVTVRYAELAGMPSSATVAGLAQKGVRVSTRPRLPGQQGTYKFAGAIGAGYVGKPEQTAAMWTAFLTAVGNGMAMIRDAETLAHLETVVEKAGIPTMPDGSPVTGRVLAYLLAVEAASEHRTATHQDVAATSVFARVVRANA